MAKQSALDLGSTGVKTDAQPPDPATVQKALTQLEQAIRDHAEWHENLLRAVVCASSFDLNDLTEGAHFQCRFGRWYYEQAVDEVRRQPSFAVIGREHEHQHRIAAKLLRDVVADAPIVREDFEELVAAGTRLRLELDSLRSEVQASLLAREVKADLFIILTAIERVFIDFGKPDQREAPVLTVDEARKHLADGQFPPGSMGPKIRAAIEYIEAGGREVLITKDSHLKAALINRSGTRIVASAQ
jgi:carbamate kinase